MNNRFIEIRKQIGKFIANFSVREEDGKEYIFDGTEIYEGLDISTYDETGDIIPLPDGTYTIQGVKADVADGKVVSLPDKEVSKVEDKPEEETKLEEDPKEETEEPKDENSELNAELEALRAENEALKKELEELRKVPMAEPVPQRTNMSSQQIKEIPENIKGTKYEKAFSIFSK